MAPTRCTRTVQSTFEPREEAGDGEPPAFALPRRDTRLSERQQAWLRAADTFFLVSANPGEGVDASHRGGRPGFIRVEGQRLIWPDYAGNAMFNTLGNIETYPRAGVTVPDFATGATLHLTGRATIDWSQERAAEFAGAERVVTLDVDAIVELAATLPARMIKTNA